MNKHSDEKAEITRLLMGPVIARAVYVAADLGVSGQIPTRFIA